MTALTRPPAWSEDAACAGLATRTRDPWAPGDHLTPDQRAFEWHLARRICATCPVRTACAVDALHDLPRADEHTMRGGLTPDELTNLARALGLPHRRRAQHGQRSRYVAGCRCDLCRDAHRVYEHERRLWAKTQHRGTTAADVYAHLTRPLGQGRHRATAGQLVLFTDGLPAAYVTQPERPPA